MKKIAYFSLILASVAFLFTACDDNKKKESSDSQDTEVTTSEKEETTSAEEDSDKIMIIGTDQMKYDVTSITAKAGEEITIVLKTVSELPAAAMSHDLVVLDQGTAARDFGMMVSKAGGSMDDLSEEQKEPVIIATKMLAAGEQDEITFTLDEPGKYEFVCTFPGHFASMNGVITVE